MKSLNTHFGRERDRNVEEGIEDGESGRSEKNPFPLNQLIQDYDVDGDDDDDDDGGNWRRLERKKGSGELGRRMARRKMGVWKQLNLSSPS